jgi:uncharacterized protein (DUF2267 family)
LWRFFQLVQRLANRIDIAAAQHFTNQLHLAAATLFLDTLGEFNGVAQVGIERDFIQRVFPRSTSSAPRRFSSSASRLISLLLTQMISSSSSSTYHRARRRASLRAALSSQAP